MSEFEEAEPQDDNVRCPRCRTTRLRVLNKLDRIEKLYGNALMNRFRARRGDTIYHCIYCRLQFYDPRKPGRQAAGGPAKKAPAPEKTEPEPEAPTAPLTSKRSRASADWTNLSAGVTIRGSIQSAEDIYVDARVEGTLASQNHRIIIGPNGRVKASVRAFELEVLGTLSGNSQIVGSVILRKGSKVKGDIKTCDIVIEDGAQFRGNVQRVHQQARLPLV
jgi:cytoskeletal protein CcmA (bactofilin family)